MLLACLVVIDDYDARCRQLGDRRIHALTTRQFSHVRQRAIEWNPIANEQIELIDSKRSLRVKLFAHTEAHRLPVDAGFIERREIVRIYLVCEADNMSTTTNLMRARSRRTVCEICEKIRLKIAAVVADDNLNAAICERRVAFERGCSTSSVINRRAQKAILRNEYEQRQQAPKCQKTDNEQRVDRESAIVEATAKQKRIDARRPHCAHYRRRCRRRRQRRCRQRRRWSRRR